MLWLRGLTGALFLEGPSNAFSSQWPDFVAQAYKSMLRRMSPAITITLLPFALLNLIQYWQFSLNVPVSGGPAFDPLYWHSDDSLILVKYVNHCVVYQTDVCPFTNRLCQP
jgi:hypothetical protein